MKRIHHRHAPRLLAFFTSLMMSWLMSCVITMINIGIPDDFFQRWMAAFGLAFSVAFPAILIVMPIARRLVDWITAEEEGF